MRAIRSIVAISAVLFVGISGQAFAQGMIKTLRLDDGGMSATTGGVLRCAIGEEYQFALIGEDGAMMRVPMELYAPTAASSNESVVRAAVPETSANVVLVRCLGDGEAVVSAEAGGVRATYPVLAGKARQQAGARSSNR